MTSSVNMASVGETIRVAPSDSIPLSFFQVGVCLTFGTPENFYRVREVHDATQGVTLSHLRKREVVRKSYEEMMAARPFVYVIPDRPWRHLRILKEGGLYQVWPTGDLLKVRQGGFLVDAVSNQRLFVEGQRHRIPILFPVMIERWVPPPSPTALSGLTPADED